jgi:hypothetical protein
MRSLAITHTTSMLLLALCGATFVARPVQAETPKPLGAVLVVPADSFGSIIADNDWGASDKGAYKIEQIQVSQMDSSRQNQLITIRVTPHPKANPLATRAGNGVFLKIRKIWLAAIQKLNVVPTTDPTVDGDAPSGKSWVSLVKDQTTPGDLKKGDAWVEVPDSSCVIETGQRFLLMPMTMIGEFRKLNGQMFRVIHTVGMATDSQVQELAVVSIEACNATAIQLPPTGRVLLQQLNMTTGIPAAENGDSSAQPLNLAQ